MSRMTVIAALAAIALPAAAAAQGQAAPQTTQPTPRITVPSVTVTAQKEPADAQTLPIAVTAIDWSTLAAAGITQIIETQLYSPNTYFQELGARKISNPRIRGIGSSPANPGITTYLDGVPQLNTNTSSLEFIDIGQVEFVRGPQSALYGRNTLGGLINIASARPSLTSWRGGIEVPLGNFGTREVRANVNGPLTSRLALGAAFGRADRDGFTTNAITGNDIDFRSATFGKMQLLFVPTSNWETRLLVSGEAARDGDYSLRDLAALKAAEDYSVQRDYEGSSERDIFNVTFIARREGSRVSFTSTTGFIDWSTKDDTDLDYSPLPLIGRVNDESATQFTQEIRLASAGNGIGVGGNTRLRWQLGGFLFTQDYTQLAANSFSPGVLSPFITIPVRQINPEAELDDLGMGLYAQGTFTFGSRVDLTLGARFDREQKDAMLATYFDPPLPFLITAPPLETDETYSHVSPQAALSFRLRPQTLLYVSGGAGFKAGGFNPTSLPGDEAYGEEKTWNLEGGLKTTWANGRVTANASVFFIDWDDMQLNVPIPGGQGAFFISNVGNATSKGVELELGVSAAPGVELFGNFGMTDATFGEGSTSLGMNIDGNSVPGTPEYTATFGAQLSRALVRDWSLVARGEAAFYGEFKYDETNTVGQDAYSLVNLRAGIHGARFYVDGWVKNAFDQFYVPVAFAFGPLTPSGYVGEPGRPRTFGVTFGVRF